MDTYFAYIQAQLSPKGTDNADCGQVCIKSLLTEKMSVIPSPQNSLSSLYSDLSDSKGIQYPGLNLTFIQWCE